MGGFVRTIETASQLSPPTVAHQSFQASNALVAYIQKPMYQSVEIGSPMNVFGLKLALS